MSIKPVIGGSIVIAELVAAQGVSAQNRVGPVTPAAPTNATAPAIAEQAYYAQQGGQYVVTAPPQGTVVSTPPPSCLHVYAGGATDLDCGGAFYTAVPGGYQVIPPPVSATVLPSGAIDRNVNSVTYFSYGGAYYKPIYSGSGVYYEVVANPA